MANQDQLSSQTNELKESKDKTHSDFIDEKSVAMDTLKIVKKLRSTVPDVVNDLESLKEGIKIENNKYSDVTIKKINKLIGNLEESKDGEERDIVSDTKKIVDSIKKNWDNLGSKDNNKAAVGIISIVLTAGSTFGGAYGKAFSGLCDFAATLIGFFGGDAGKGQPFAVILDAIKEGIRVLEKGRYDADAASATAELKDYISFLTGICMKPLPKNEGLSTVTQSTISDIVDKRSQGTQFIGSIKSYIDTYKNDESGERGRDIANAIYNWCSLVSMKLFHMQLIISILFANHGKVDPSSIDEGKVTETTDLSSTFPNLQRIYTTDKIEGLVQLFRDTVTDTKSALDFISEAHDNNPWYKRISWRTLYCALHMLDESKREVIRSVREQVGCTPLEVTRLVKIKNKKWGGYLRSTNQYKDSQREHVRTWKDEPEFGEHLWKIYWAENNCTILNVWECAFLMASATEGPGGDWFKGRSAMLWLAGGTVTNGWWDIQLPYIFCNSGTTDTGEKERLSQVFDMGDTGTHFLWNNSGPNSTYILPIQDEWEIIDLPPCRL